MRESISDVPTYSQLQLSNVRVAIESNVYHRRSCANVTMVYRSRGITKPEAANTSRNKQFLYRNINIYVGRSP